MAEIKTRLVVRNDSSANWESVKDTAVLLKGEMGIEFLEDGTPKVRIGDGVTAWGQLPYFGAEEAKTFQVGALSEIPADAELAVGDTAIVKTAIYVNAEDETKNKYSYTGYVYNGSEWTAMDGNYNAKNVILDSNFTFTAPIGIITQKEITDNKGSITREAAGKSIQDFLASIFAKEEYPTAAAPSVSWTTEPKGTVEVGTEITPTYNAKLNAGSYTYGPDTGITAKSWTVDVADLTDENKATNSGSFSKFTAVDDMSGYAKITATAYYDAGAVPVTNIGNEYPSKQIGAGSKSATSAGYTSYRAWFYGYKAGGSTLTVADMDSDDVRALTSANGAFTTSMTTTDMQQMFFAAPAGKVKSVEVANSVNGAPQTVKYATVYVKGNNNYVVTEADATETNTVDGMKYDLFYVDNDNAEPGTATYTITTTKA